MNCQVLGNRRKKAPKSAREGDPPKTAGSQKKKTSEAPTNGNGDGGDDGPAEGDENAAPVSADPNPRRRVIRLMLKKLVKKGKIGAAHTHEDNVYRGVADHEKGIAKDAMDPEDPSMLEDLLLAAFKDAAQKADAPKQPFDLERALDAMAHGGERQVHRLVDHAAEGLGQRRQGR